MAKQLSVSRTSGEESTSLWKFCFQRREKRVPKNGFSDTGVSNNGFSDTGISNNGLGFSDTGISNNGLGFSDLDVSKYQVHGILTMLFANEAWDKTGGIVFHCLSISVSCHAFPLFGKLLFNQQPHDL